MYHLLKGLHEYLTRKEEFSVIIIGLDGAGKTTLLEKIKTLYNETPGLDPSKIGPTVGQNTGKISLPSSIINFFDLGGQRGIRSIWHRYYDDCHAVAYVIDAQDRERLSEGWETPSFPPPKHSTSPSYSSQTNKIPLQALAEMERKRERIASLDVLGVSGLDGHVDWLFLRVQNSRRDLADR
ncbi:ADP-ribosylation factor family-domain-containing protein [Suillus occidentalis]|nr:ADP-ribosylation factor family-domain-containing protein [Suillus occidentalis]